MREHEVLLLTCNAAEWRQVKEREKQAAEQQAEEQKVAQAAAAAQVNAFCSLVSIWQSWKFIERLVEHGRHKPIEHMVVHYE